MAKPTCSTPTPLLLTKTKTILGTTETTYQCVSDTSDNAFNAAVASCKQNNPTYSGTPTCTRTEVSSSNLSSGNKYWYCSGTTRC